MLDSDFWQELAEKFRAIDPQRLLRADWDSVVRAGEPPPDEAEWRLAGSDRQTRSEFDALARRGGPRVYPYRDSLIGWLEALREYGLNTEVRLPAEEINPDSTVAARHYTGSIMRVCEASVDLCKHYESMALEIERSKREQEERQRIEQRAAIHSNKMGQSSIPTRTMAELDSDFWKARAGEFTAHDAIDVRAHWIKIDENDFNEWSLIPRDDATALAFDALARRCGDRLEPDAPDALIVWLEALKLRVPPDRIGSGRESREGIVTGYTSGTIAQLWTESANLCKVLESRAIEKERKARLEEVRKNDPENRPALLQQYEAFKAIKDLVTGPREEISESLMRQLIAQHNGIKPEEVTPQQLRFEVAGLLPRYPSIKLIQDFPNTTTNKTKRRKKKSQRVAPRNLDRNTHSPIDAPPPTMPINQKSIGEQIEALRLKCDWTAEFLAEQVELTPRSVYRHLSGEDIPSKLNLAKYNRCFSEKLGIEVVIQQTSVKVRKRQKKS